MFSPLAALDRLTAAVEYWPEPSQSCTGSTNLLGKEGFSGPLRLLPAARFRILPVQGRPGPACC